MKTNQIKIGDKIYQHDFFRIYEMTITEITIFNGLQYYITNQVDFDERAIGKNIFLSKEEAQKRIKEYEVKKDVR